MNKLSDPPLDYRSVDEITIQAIRDRWPNFVPYKSLTADEKIELAHDTIAYMEVSNRIPMIKVSSTFPGPMPLMLLDYYARTFTPLQEDHLD